MLYHHQSIERRTFFTGKLSPSLCLPTPIPLRDRVHLSTIICVSTALVTITLPSFPHVSVSSLSYLSAYLLTDHGFVIIFPITIAMLEVYRHTKDVEYKTSI